LETWCRLRSSCAVCRRGRYASHSYVYGRRNALLICACSLFGAQCAEETRPTVPFPNVLRQLALCIIRRLARLLCLFIHMCTGKWLHAQMNLCNVRCQCAFLSEYLVTVYILRTHKVLDALMCLFMLPLSLRSRKCLCTLAPSANVFSHICMAERHVSG
jgi:hypothetical protein